MHETTETIINTGSHGMPGMKQTLLSIVSGCLSIGGFAMPEEGTMRLTGWIVGIVCGITSFICAVMAIKVHRLELKKLRLEMQTKKNE